MTNKSKNNLIRDDKWLLSRLDYVWREYFSDILQTNEVFIRFGRFAKYRLGSIKMDKKKKQTFITITSMFQNHLVPQEVIDHTIAHEMVHYIHGFSSPHAKLHKYPHAGGIIKKEIFARGMQEQFYAYKDWIKTYRKAFSRYG